jgi:hypothetical protein
MKLIAWGVGLLLVVLLVGLFFGYGSQLGPLVVVAKWLIGAGIILVLVWAIFGAMRGTGGPGPF